MYTYISATIEVLKSSIRTAYHEIESQSCENVKPPVQRAYINNFCYYREMVQITNFPNIQHITEHLVRFQLILENEAQECL